MTNHVTGFLDPPLNACFQPLHVVAKHFYSGKNENIAGISRADRGKPVFAKIIRQTPWNENKRSLN